MQQLLKEKQEIEYRLNHLLYGSIQIRQEADKKYIYLYYREAGILKNRYAGVYSEELHNLLIKNNMVAKEYKKRLKQINKELDKYEKANQLDDESVELSIAIAKRNLVNTIYKQSVLEGIATTYSDTEILVNEGFAHNMNSEDVTKILNLKHAWNFILDRDVLTYVTNYAILCEINRLVEEGISTLSGKIRILPVSIGGSAYIPPIPLEHQVKEELDILLSREISIDTGIELLLYVMKKQLFIDGNKRTAVIFANHYLIRNGLGIVVIPAENVNEYKKHLINYYEDKDLVSIKKFLKIKCWIKVNQSNNL